MVHSVEELADRAMKRWEFSRRSEFSEPHRPCIAISRYPGAGAATLGQRVAESLDYAYFGIELVDWIARRTGLARQLIAGVDERIRNTIDRSVADTFRREKFTESDYLHQVVSTITTLGERGGAVILGRGSPFILPPERALRVFVVAPREQRVERLAKERALSAEDAAKTLDRDDASRREFLEHNFGRDPDDPTHYDLMLNLGTLSMDAAAALLVDAVLVRFPSTVRHLNSK
jgi:cytidylate kinase